MQSHFGTHLLDGSCYRFANRLSRTLSIELLANAATAASGRFDLVLNGLAFIPNLLLTRRIFETGRFLSRYLIRTSR